MANRIFGSVGWYIQGPGLLEEIGRHLKPLGRRIAVVADEVVWGLSGQRSTRLVAISIHNI